MSSSIHQKARWALLLVLPVLVAVVMHFFGQRVKEENEWVKRTLVVQLSLERLLADLDSAESSERAFLLTHEERLLEPYREAVPQIRQELVSLRALMAENPRQRQALSRIEPLIHAKLAHMDESATQYGSPALDATTMVHRIDASEALMDSIEAVAGEMRAEEARLLKQRELDFASGTTRFNWSVALGYLLMVAVVMSLYRAVQRYSRQAKQAEQNLARLNSLLEQRVRERTFSLQASEDLLKTFVKHVPAAVAMLDRRMHYLQVSDRWCADNSLSSREVLSRSHYDVFPGLPDQWKRVHQDCLNGANSKKDEDCFERQDGSRVWLRWEIRPWGLRDGLPEGILIFTEDITERKRMEEALRSSERGLRELAAGLLTAQADERRRIARDLHDDVTQRLALLSIEIGKLAGANGFPTEASKQLSALQDQAKQISQEVRRLSHGLHPSVIEDLGLSSALEEFCEEFSRAQGVAVRFEADTEDIGLSSQAASSLFRIAQEGVQNAAKHAGATEVRVVLSRGPEGVQLRVTDNGKGFPAGLSPGHKGLGIVSMTERARMLNGTLSISSQPDGGTRVVASVPFAEGDHETAYSAR